ncbi:MAG: iron-sulfur cluster repair di-iron protein [Ignavibacteria bacterium]
MHNFVIEKLNTKENKMNFTTQNTLAEIVKSDFRTARVFENHNLDFCCKGNRALAEACIEQKLDANEILSEVTSVCTEKNSEKDSASWKTEELVNHILNTHHVYVKRMLPVILAHSQKVSEVHGKNHAEVKEIAEIFERIHNELSSHLMKEERMLFPIILQLSEMEKNNSKMEVSPFGSIQNPIDVMEREHVEAGEGFYKIRELSNNYNPPEDACTTYKILYQELNEFEQDLHTHIHLENNILFPKAVELEKKLMGNQN